MLNSPHAYNQNKAFTKHIIDAMMKSFEEKLELEVLIPRKLYDEWEPTINVRWESRDCMYRQLIHCVHEHIYRYKGVRPLLVSQGIQISIKMGLETSQL